MEKDFPSLHLAIITVREGKRYLNRQRKDPNSMKEVSLAYNLVQLRSLCTSHSIVSSNSHGVPNDVKAFLTALSEIFGSAVQSYADSNIRNTLCGRGELIATFFKNIIIRAMNQRLNIYCSGWFDICIILYNRFTALNLVFLYIAPMRVKYKYCYFS